MDQIINKTQYKLHKRKSSQFKESKNKFSLPIDRPRDLKGDYLKKVRQVTIQTNNLILAQKVEELKNKRQRNKVQNYQMTSLNFKQRLHHLQQIHKQNLEIIKRLSSQKSMYSFKDYQKRPQVNSRIRTRAYTNLSLPHEYKNTERTYQILPNNKDDYGQRIVHFCKIEYISNHRCNIEISSTDKFYYVSLDFKKLKKHYKLRLIYGTGKHLMRLIQKNQHYFKNRITYNNTNNEVQLQIPFLPFMRKYNFIQIKKPKIKKQTMKMKVQNKDNNILTHVLKQFENQTVSVKLFSVQKQQNQYREESIDDDNNNEFYDGDKADNQESKEMEQIWNEKLLQLQHVQQIIQQ